MITVNEWKKGLAATACAALLAPSPAFAAAGAARVRPMGGLNLALNPAGALHGLSFPAAYLPVIGREYVGGASLDGFPGLVLADALAAGEFRREAAAAGLMAAADAGDAPGGALEAGLSARDSAEAIAARAPEEAGDAFDAASPGTQAVEAGDAALEPVFRAPSSDGMSEVQFVRGPRWIVRVLGRETSQILRLGEGESVAEVAPVSSLNGQTVYFVVADSEGGASLRSLNTVTGETASLTAPGPVKELAVVDGALYAAGHREITRWNPATGAAEVMRDPSAKGDLQLLDIRHDGATVRAYNAAAGKVVQWTSDGVRSRDVPSGVRSAHVSRDGRHLVYNHGGKLSVHDAATFESIGSVKMRQDGVDGVVFLGRKAHIPGAYAFVGPDLQVRDGASPRTIDLRGMLEAADRTERAEAEAVEALARERDALARELAAAKAGAADGVEADGAAVPAPGKKDVDLSVDAKPWGVAKFFAGALATIESVKQAWRRMRSQQKVHEADISAYVSAREQHERLDEQVKGIYANAAQGGDGTAKWMRVMRLGVASLAAFAFAGALVAVDIAVFGGFWSGVFANAFGIVPANLMPLVIAGSLQGLVSIGILRAAKGGHNKVAVVVAVAVLAALALLGVMVGAEHMAMGAAGAAPAAAAPAGSAADLAAILGTADAGAAVAAPVAAAPTGVVGSILGVLSGMGMIWAGMGPLGALIMAALVVGSAVAGHHWIQRGAGLWSRLFGERLVSEEEWGQIKALRSKMRTVQAEMRRMERRFPGIVAQAAARKPASAGMEE